MAPKAKAEPKSKDKAKRLNEKAPPGKDKPSKDGKTKGAPLDTAGIKKIRGRFDYGKNHTDPDKVAEAKKAEEVYNLATREEKEEILSKLESNPGLKFVAQYTSTKVESERNNCRDIEDYCDEYEIMRHKPMPAADLQTYLSCLDTAEHPSKEHWDPAMVHMGKRLYYFKHKFAREHTEEDSSLKTLKCESTNLTMKMVNALADGAENPGTSSGSKGAEVQVLACAEFTLMNMQAKSSAVEGNKLQKELNNCQILLSALAQETGEHAKNKHNLYTVEMTNVTKFHGTLLDALGICKAVSPQDKDQAVEAMKILKQAKNDVVLSLMGIKEAKADVQKFLVEAKKVEAIQDAEKTDS